MDNYFEVFRRNKRFDLFEVPEGEEGTFSRVFDMRVQCQFTVEGDAKGFDGFGGGEGAVQGIKVFKPRLNGKGVVFRREEDNLCFVGIKFQMVQVEPGLDLNESVIEVYDVCMRVDFIVQLSVVSVKVIVKSGTFKQEGKRFHEEVEQCWGKDRTLRDPQGGRSRG